MTACHVMRFTNPVRASILDPFPVTTYQQGYTGHADVLPIIKYHQMSSFVHAGLDQHLKKQLSLDPMGPARTCARNKEEYVFKNRNLEKNLDLKLAFNSPLRELVQSTKPTRNRETEARPAEKNHEFETKFGKMDMNMVNKLVNHIRWTSTTADAGQEEFASIPVPEIRAPETTLEPKADLVRLHSRKYEAAPADWQKCIYWDCVQPRGTVTHGDLLEKTHGQPEKLFVKRKSLTGGYREESERIRKMSKEKMLANIYVRQCPGYAGFVPRAPPEGQMERKLEGPHMVSTMKATYRELPASTYEKQQNARKGPFSKTVTLTYPFNPYNKVVQRCVLTESHSSDATGLFDIGH
ncbi:uncharacterized protein LOC110467495 [Mizuhopecten yessoensis]|uniref:Uncharacterized protein n=1 Tax=Mizuhopecten yessoensis TaxID=6573 RepID=A0A210PLS6_MIZYE|nr:uncharacterized protein LOC110467495 [Mizuhopecten yessoensis]OWF37376.1 hypothetical protein KP79_PYT14003 [Mizuhopecten yessoensis]